MEFAPDWCLCSIPGSVVLPRANRLFTFVAAMLAAGMALLFLGLGLVAASPELHQRFHDDRQATDGPCLVCLLVKGQMESPEPTLPTPTVSNSVAYTQPLPVAAVLPDFDYSVSPCRAPPGLFFLLPDAA